MKHDKRSGSAGDMADSTIATLIQSITRQALAASRVLGTISSAQKNAALGNLAALLESPQQRAELVNANQLDLAAAEASGLSGAMVDRLRLTPQRIDAMVTGIRQVIALPDPVGEVIETYSHPLGFDIAKRRVPIGVVGIVFESRPNVTVDCAVLCLKSGNAAILRGGKEALHSNLALAALVTMAMESAGLPLHAVQLIPTTDRTALELLLRADDCVHCLIPRGGEGLIRFVVEHARMPVIKHFTGVCNIFVDAAADLTMATGIAVNAKCQRPGVCNAVENLLVHEALLASGMAGIATALHAQGVELRADERAMRAIHAAGVPCSEATDTDYRTEYLAKILSIKTVSSVEEAVSFIHHYGSGHSDAIVTANPATAKAFLDAVDSAAVYWNVSTRFTDGFEFGMGAEIGISTDRLHARGPMGLRELCSYKFVTTGNGQIRP